jgi:3-hydroxyacyl-CoA dehydrogenase / enoyl-CoA hydratase / 3-hydroxybutyryl-CoA epimerase
MGGGIAYAQASKGIETVVKDVSVEKAEIGKLYAKKITDPRVAKGKLSPHDQAAMLARIKATDSAADLKGCELIVEAVFEKRDLKAQVTKEAEPMLADGGFFASNTSTLPISGLAQASAAPEKFIGIHFFSPVDKMKLVEIIKGQQTNEETLARAYDYVLALGKLPIVVNDSRGFFTSRTFGTFVMEGAAMLGEGVPAPLIENASVQVGMPVGALAVLDETSLSLSLHVRDQTRADFAAEGKTYVDHPGELVVEKLARELGRAGRAAGKGFYDYPEGGKKMLWPDLAKHFAQKPGFEAPAAFAELKDRILYRQAIETARCLHENVLTTVHDANIGSIFGIGFPAWTGGALQFIYTLGVDAFGKRCNELAAKHGERFAVSDAVLATLKKHEPRY